MNSVQNILPLKNTASDIAMLLARLAFPTDTKDMHCSKSSMQQGCLQHSRERDIAPGVLEETCPQGNDKILLDFIESDAVCWALRLLKEKNSFSQDALNRALISACRHGHKYIVQTLVRHGAYVQYKDTHGNTPLLICAEKGFTDIVRFLLTKKADISTVNSAGDTGLILSICSSGSTDMTRFLLQQGGININHQNRNGYTALMKAIEVMDIDTVEMLLVEYIKLNVAEASRACVGVDFQWMLIDKTVNCKGETAQQIADKTGLGDIFKLLRLHLCLGMSPLVLAVHTCETESLSVLLDCHFSPPFDMRRSVNEAFFQIFKKCQMKNIKNFNDKEVTMVKTLLECGADMSTGWNGDINFDPVSIAVQAKCYTLVELLHKHGFKSKNKSMKLPSTVKGGNRENNGQILNAGANINPSSKVGVTPLIESKHQEFSQLLIQRGIDFNRATGRKHGREKPLIQIIMNRHINDPSTVEVVKGLLENGASVNGRSSDGRTPLMLAALKEGSVNVLQILLDRGANFCHCDREGNTALMNAIAGNCNTNVSFLIKFTKGREYLLNSRNDKGLTALMNAVTCGNTTAMKELIDHGANMNITDVNGNTVLLHVLKSPRPEKQVLKVLISAGSDVNCQNNEGLSPLMLAARRRMDDAVSVLLDSGADVNAVSNRDNTKTALSFLPCIPWFDESTRCCIESLLYRGASSSYMNPLVLHRIIFQDQIKVIPKLIQCGLGPADVMFSEVSMITRPEVDIICSPLCAALMTGHITLARFFMGNLFLTKRDMSPLLFKSDLSWILKRHKHKECLDFLDEISSQPPSLFKLSFVAVLSAVGTSPGRENRVNMLPLPQIMKNKLLFKSLEVNLEATALNKGTRSINSLHQLNSLFYDMTDYDFGDSDSDYSWDSSDCGND